MNLFATIWNVLVPSIFALAIGIVIGIAIGKE